MKTLHNLLDILLAILLGIFLITSIREYALAKEINSPAEVVLIQRLLSVFLCAIIFHQQRINNKLRKAVEKQKKNASIPYCCPGHDFSCPYISAPYQKSIDCSKCENGPDLIKVWILNNSAWDDNHCPSYIKRYADTECYMARVIALKEAKETKNVGVGSCVFVNGIGGYYELVSKVRL